MRTDEKMAKICDSLKVLGCGNASEKIQDAITNGLDDPLSVVCLALGTAAVNVKNAKYDKCLRISKIGDPVFLSDLLNYKVRQLDLEYLGYTSYWNSAEKKGYSGTAIYTKRQPISVTYGIGVPEHDAEGRVITLEMPDFYLVCVYTPNSQDGLRRLDYRMVWDDAFREYVLSLKAKKGDIKNPKANRRNAGFTDEERDKFSVLLDSGFVDTWRSTHPDEVKYSWWSYRFRARENNAGWRIDYFLVSEDLREKIESTDIHNEIFGSDHCPVELVLSL